MSTRHLTRIALSVFLATLSLVQLASVCGAGQILVVDRVANSVYRYSDSGAYLGTLLTAVVDPAHPEFNLLQPDGIAISPDHTKLYVASSQNNEVVQYDYNYAAGTATNPTVFADASKGLAFPNAMAFSPDGTKLYVANFGGTGITQLNADGSSAGPNIAGGTSTQFSGLAFGPNGTLLAGGFDGGTVAQSNAAITSVSDFIGPSASLSGAAGVLVNGNDLYVSGLFTGVLARYNATTGAVDPSFSVSGLSFPQGVMLAPDGNGLLVGILGLAPGSGKIARFGFDGASLGDFALPNPPNGFSEATAMLSVPEPTTFSLLGFALAMLGLMARRRFVRRR